MEIRVKRIYEEPSQEDGYRVLIDRLWPRGMKKETAALDEWNKEISPSTELRKWFHGHLDRFDEFAAMYREELLQHEEELIRLRQIAGEQPLTLLFASKNIEANHAHVLKQYLAELG